MTTKSAKITKDTIFLDMLKTYPETSRVLKKYNLACASCLGAQNEPIDLGATNHGIELDALLKDLNAAIKQG